VGWTDLLNAGPGAIRLGPVDVDVYHWAEMADTVVNPPHRHTYYEVCWVEGGTGEFTVDGRTHPIGPGSLLFARPGVPHRIVSRSAPGIRLAWVAFHLRLVPGPATSGPRSEATRMDGAGVRGAGTIGTAPDDGEMADLFGAFAGSARPLAHDAHDRVAALWAALRATGDGPALPGQGAATAAVAEALLVALAQAGTESLRPRSSAAPDPGAAAVRLVLRYVQDNLDRPLPVEELARHAHLSPRQLSRLFAVHVGQSPAGYIERTRLDHAAALLVRTDLPIKRIAAEVGYGDVAGFTRAFARRLGTPPGRFRSAANLQPVLSVS
jgi:AraC-like DNA-binding protein